MAMTWNAGRGMTTDERDRFLTTGAIFAKIATTMADGWPVVSPVWFDWRAQDLTFTAATTWHELPEPTSPGGPAS